MIVYKNIASYSLFLLILDIMRTLKKCFRISTANSKKEDYSHTLIWSDCSISLSCSCTLPRPRPIILTTYSCKWNTIIVKTSVQVGRENIDQACPGVGEGTEKWDEQRLPCSAGWRRSTQDLQVGRRVTNRPRWFYDKTCVVSLLLLNWLHTCILTEVSKPTTLNSTAIGRWLSWK